MDDLEDRGALCRIPSALGFYGAPRASKSRRPTKQCLTTLDHRRGAVITMNVPDAGISESCRDITNSTRDISRLYTYL